MKVVRLNGSNFILVYALVAQLKTACQPRAHAQPRGPLQGCRLSMKVVRLNDSNFILVYALVAQLDSVSASDAEGCGFDPRRVHQQKKPPCGAFFVGLPCRIDPPGSSRRRRHEALCAEVSPPRPPWGFFCWSALPHRSKDCRPRAEWRAGGKLFPETFTAQKARSAPR